MRTSALPLALACLLCAAPLQAQDHDESDAAPAKGLMGPRTGEAREKALHEYGGNDSTEKAVEAGLDWLARHRKRRGLWDADGFHKRCERGSKRCDGVGKGHHGEDVPCPFDAAISAMATLAFLGHGHAPDPKGDKYARLVDEALDDLRGGSDAWSRALATQCYAEAEALEGKGRWTRQVERGVEGLLGSRGEDGAWGYISSFRKGSDVPYSAFVVQALAAAKDTGVELPDELGKRVDAYLSSLEESKGKLAYLVDGRKYGYTPTSNNAHLAAAMRELLQAGTDGKRHKAHLGLLSRSPPLWKISFKKVKVPGRGTLPIQMGNLNMYQWWYGTVATFHRGGSAWSKWWGKTKSALVPHQEKKGCRRGSWDPEGLYERKVGGRVFATALGVLMLEQPYRHRRRD